MVNLAFPLAQSEHFHPARFMMADTLPVKVEFGGGTELLFDKQKLMNLDLPCDEIHDWTIRKLINYLKQNHIKERVELFAIDDKIRPGILILVNDVDYEILGGDEYVLKSNDSVLFISTLHGG